MYELGELLCQSILFFLQCTKKYISVKKENFSSNFIQVDTLSKDKNYKPVTSNH